LIGFPGCTNAEIIGLLGKYTEAWPIKKLMLENANLNEEALVLWKKKFRRARLKVLSLSGLSCDPTLYPMLLDCLKEMEVEELILST